MPSLGLKRTKLSTNIIFDMVVVLANQQNPFGYEPHV